MLTTEQIETDFKFVSKQFDKNDKLAWNRKKVKLDLLIEQLKPFEDRMLEIIKERQPIMDKIVELRNVMVHECVHPIDSLVHKDAFIHCKFCDAKLTINKYKYFIDEQ